MWALALAAVLGMAAGVLSGLFGVGGGILCVPTLTLVLGLGAIAGVEAGVQIAESLPEHALRRLFALLMLVVAAQLAWRARRKAPYAS